MDRTTTRQQPTTSRRRLLCSGVAAGVVGLAGCTGDESAGETPDTDESDDDTDGNGVTTDDGPAADDDEATDDDTSSDENTTAIDLEPEDGWGERHEGLEVDVPDEPGTAELHVAGQTTTLQGIGWASPVPDGEVGAHGGDTFEAGGAFQGGELEGAGVQVEFSRLLGHEDNSGRWAVVDGLTLSRDDATRLATIIHRRHEEGHVATASDVGDLEGRRVVEESFVRVEDDGVVTIAETIDSHEDEALDGRLEFAARFQPGWEDA